MCGNLRVRPVGLWSRLVGIGRCTGSLRATASGRVRFAPWACIEQVLERRTYTEVTMSKVMFLPVAVALMMVAALGAAQSSPSDDEPHGPRPEAIAACKDKSEGDACEFDGPRGHVAGSCRKARTGDLACMHPHHHHDGGTQ